jgi:hypothetical protein
MRLDRTGTEEETQQTVWRRPENSSNVKIPGAGHLVRSSLVYVSYGFVDDRWNEGCTRSSSSIR